MSTTTQSNSTANSAAPLGDIRVYNTLSKQKEPFEPVTPGQVGIYLCGPTVYDKAHIGHMVGPVIFDCIKRYLVYCGYQVNWVVNITDVDDKLINKANERGISMAEVAAENTADYLENLAALGVDSVDHMPTATDSMDDIIAFITGLVEQGFAYASDGDVYFEVGKDAEYGKLSNRSVESSQGEGGGMADRKRSPGDFALWKSAKPGEPSWESPWGSGRPGWHIECSAMSKRLLGETFDIHGGGLDLVFPHHENEIAQSECRHGKPMVKYWMHNGLMQANTAAGKVGGRSDRAHDSETGDSDSSEPQDTVAGKISRSKGGAEGASALAGLIARQGGERIRFFLLRTHYRSTIVFSEEGIEEAGTALDTFYRFFKRYERVTGRNYYALDAPATRAAGGLDPGDEALLVQVAALRDKFVAAMDDDFNTGSAIAELFELVRALNKYADQRDLESPGEKPQPALGAFVRGTEVLAELTRTLGLFRAAPAGAAEGDALVGQVMGLIIELRAAARAGKDFATADTIRDTLTSLGITLEDRAGATEWTAAAEVATDALMQLVIQIRATARANKDFATADTIRDGLAAIGITLEDRAGATEWTAG
jgi:cysteinyl-tRNA synthetase